MPKIKKNKENTQESIKKEPYKRQFEHQFGKRWSDDEIEALGDRMYNWFTTPLVDSNGKKKDRLWLKDFTVLEMIPAQKTSEFAARNDYFSFILQVCKEKQESILFHLGLISKSAMPIFALKATQGWRDDNGDNEHGNKFAELAEIFGQTLVRIAGAGKTASNNPEVPQ